MTSSDLTLSGLESLAHVLQQRLVPAFPQETFYILGTSEAVAQAKEQFDSSYVLFETETFVAYRHQQHPFVYLLLRRPVSSPNGVLVQISPEEFWLL